METNILWGNYTFADIAKEKPFGYEFINPPLLAFWRIETYNLYHLVSWMEENVNLVYYVDVIYLLTIFGIRHWMKDKKAWDLKWALVLWNLMLTVFSVIVFVRILPSLLYTLRQPDGFYTSLCVKKDMDLQSAFWGYLFVVSKFVELGDTIFIVLRKRPLLFIQWYHHLVTLTVSWINFPFVEPMVRWYGVLNSGVHSIMYPYFALKVLRVKVPPLFAKMLTTIQLAQMFMAFYINAATSYYFFLGDGCVRHMQSILTWNFMFSTFICLFGKLFYDTVLATGKSKKKVA